MFFGFGRKFDETQCGSPTWKYFGSSGMTDDCLEDLSACLQVYGNPDKVILISGPSSDGVASHGMMIIFEDKEVLILPGFASGYSGGGPNGLLSALSMIKFFDLSLHETVIDNNTMVRFKSLRLIRSDIAFIRNCCRHISHRKYISNDIRGFNHYPINFWANHKSFFPLGIFDYRLLDLAIRALKEPHNMGAIIFEGFTLLESILRDRVINLGFVDDESGGASLCAKVFRDKSPYLTWAGLSSGEIEGRRLLFMGGFRAIRNARAHAPVSADHHREIREMMFLNQLFIYESEAIPAVIS